MKIRTYKRQFEKGFQKKIEDTLGLLDDVCFSNKDYYYQIFELKSCLYSGLMLSALHVASSLLELFVRDLVINYEMSVYTENMRSNEFIRFFYSIEIREEIGKDVEKNRSLGFSKLVDILFDNKMINDNERDQLKDFYNYIRIPLLHGIIRRFIEYTLIICRFQD